jgi:hypothetical protein
MTDANAPSQSQAEVFYFQQGAEGEHAPGAVFVPVEEIADVGDTALRAALEQQARDLKAGGKYVHFASADEAGRLAVRYRVRTKPLFPPDTTP